MRSSEQEVAAYNYLTPATMAERLNCSPKKIKALVRSGAIQPAVNIGTTKKPLYRVAPEAFEAYLQAVVVEPAA